VHGLGGGVYELALDSHHRALPQDIRGFDSSH
jgi:hypothetical protein